MPSVSVATGGRLPLDEVLPDTRGHHHAPGAQPHPDRLAQRRQEVRQPGLPHPVAQVQGVAAIHQQDVGLSDPGDPAFFVDAGQRGELQHAQGLPTQLAHGASGSCPLMKRHALTGPTWGCPYPAVGMQRALDSAIGLPSRSTSALWMLAFLMPADVSRSFMLPPGLPVLLFWLDRSATRNSSVARHP